MSTEKIEIKIPAGATEVTLKTAGKYCDKDIRVASHFRIEQGVIRGGSEYIADYYKDDVLRGKTISIPCSASPKLVIFKATEATQAKIVSLTAEGTTFSGNCTYAFILNNIIDLDAASGAATQGRNCLVCQFLKYENGKVYSTYSDTPLTDIDTMPKTIVSTFYNETDAEYTWVAYYWDE